MRNYKFSISEQIEKAKLSMSNGSFPSKAAQKDVMGDLNRAYSQAIDAKSYDALEAAGYSYIDVPFDLHQVRPRHEDQYLSLLVTKPLTGEPVKFVALLTK